MLSSISASCSPSQKVTRLKCIRPSTEPSACRSPVKRDAIGRRPTLWRFLDDSDRSKSLTRWDRTAERNSAIEPPPSPGTPKQSASRSLMRRRSPRSGTRGSWLYPTVGAAIVAALLPAQRGNQIIPSSRISLHHVMPKVFASCSVANILVRWPQRKPNGSWLSPVSLGLNSMVTLVGCSSVCKTSCPCSVLRHSNFILGTHLHTNSLRAARTSVLISVTSRAVRSGNQVQKLSAEG